MAKTAKIKKRTPSIHSRAARRAASPSLNLDKSLKTVAPPKTSGLNLFAVRDGGVKKQKVKQMTRNQKFRQHKGLERADIVKDQLELKVQKSVGKLKKVRERRKGWEELNLKKPDKHKSSFAALANLPEADGDVDMTGGGEVTQAYAEREKPLETGVMASVQAASLPLRPPADIPLPPDEGDEIE